MPRKKGVATNETVRTGVRFDCDWPELRGTTKKCPTGSEATMSFVDVYEDECGQGTIGILRVACEACFERLSESGHRTFPISDDNVIETLRVVHRTMSLKYTTLDRLKEMIDESGLYDGL